MPRRQLGWTPDSDPSQQARNPTRLRVRDIRWPRRRGASDPAIRQTVVAARPQLYRRGCMLRATSPADVAHTGQPRTSDEKADYQYADHSDHRDDGLHYRPALNCLANAETEVTLYEPEARVVDVREEQGSTADGQSE
jgi:hypothetical protein